MTIQKQTIYLASDHAGFDRKQNIKTFLTAIGYEVEDLGPKIYVAEDDYPDYAFPLAQKVAAQQGQGIVICGNGQGVCIATNKVQGIRAVSAFTPDMAKTTRIDDNANVLCLPSRFLRDQEIEDIITAWLKTPFSQAPRHVRRLAKISHYEEQK